MSNETTKIAIIETGGKQYIVSENDIFDIEKLTIDLNTKKSPEIIFDHVLLYSDGKACRVGTPDLQDVKVKATVLNPAYKDKKKIVFKFKKKTGYKVTQGHRQSYTTVKITSISTTGTKKASSTSDKENKVPTKKKEIKKIEK